MVATLAYCATLLLLFLSPLSSDAQAQIPDDHVALFVFGDSLYDTGMTLYYGPPPTSANLPYGETYFKRAAGRYTDGRTIPDLIAQYASLPFPQPYLLPGLNNFTNGVSFASASACILVGVRPNTINVKMQVDYFVEMVQKLEQQVGQAEATKLLSKAVYLFNVGGNDYTTPSRTNLGKPPFTAAWKKQYLDQVFGNFTTYIKTIYNKGGRKFAFQNVGPLGCMPASKDAKGACLLEAQDLIRMHNSRLLKQARLWKIQFPGFTYSVYDFFASAFARIKHPKKYGLKVVDRACCGSGQWNGQFTCAKPKSNFTLCSDPSEYLFFDAGHTTEFANLQFSQEFWTGSRMVGVAISSSSRKLVKPYNLKTLFDMH